MTRLRARVTALLAAVGAATLLLTACSPVADPDTVPTPAPTEAAAPANTEGYALSAGDGPVTIQLWTDLACPHCQSLEAEVGADLEQWVADGDVTLVIHPLNFVSAKRGDATDWSTRAANALAAAVDAGDAAAVPAFYALLQENQVTDAGAPTDDDILALAEQAGVTADLREAVESQRFAAWVTASNDHWIGRTIDGTQQVVQGVPLLVVDGAVFEISGDGTDAARLADAVSAALG